MDILTTNLFNNICHPYLKPEYVSACKQDLGLIIKLKLPFVITKVQQDEISSYLTQYILQAGITLPISYNFDLQIIPHKIKQGLVRIKNIKNILAVTSGKGGVGKSTVATNLAIALSRLGANVGLLDADIYGPSVPTLLGERQYQPEVENAKFVPLSKYGIKAMSFGFLIKEDQAAIWRGAIVNKAIEQMVFDSLWGELDYLIIDMPPGTGDIHLTMCQKMPITATIAVTTPQDIALRDVIKSIEMYQKLGIPTLGIVENMSSHICTQCGHEEDIFGSGAAELLATHYKLDILAKLPLTRSIMLASDKGEPRALSDDSLSQLYAGLAGLVSIEMSHLAKDYSANLGKIQAI